MSKKNKDSHEYQLWVWYGTQDADHPQNGYILSEYETPEQLFIAVLSLNKDDKYYTTQNVDLQVRII